MPDLDPQEIAKLRKRVEELEARMDQVFQRLGMPQPGVAAKPVMQGMPAKPEAPRAEPPKAEPPKWRPSPMVMALVRKGEKETAVKAFMRETGASLKDAKEFIDKL
jgi:ribosomal protein L7/L12